MIFGLAAEGRALVLCAELAGEIIAAATFGIHHRGAIYWTGASDARGLSTGANALLQYAAMAQLSRGGITHFEIGDAFPHLVAGKNAGLDLFKRSFGGDLHRVVRGRRPASRARYALLYAVPGAARVFGPR